MTTATAQAFANITRIRYSPASRLQPDGTRLATAGLEGNAKLWDAKTGKELLTLSGHTGQVFSIAFSPVGKTVATASGDKTAKLWDSLTGKDWMCNYS